MRFLSRWLWLVALLPLAAGCQKQTDIPDSPAPVTQPPKETTSVTPPVAATPAPKNDAELKAYNAKLTPILVERDQAELHWRQAVAKIPPEGNWLARLVGPTEQYAKAVDKAAHSMEAIASPKEAKTVHDALHALFRRLGDNLDATVAAMRSDGGQDPGALASEQKTIEAEGAQAVQSAIEVSGFDIQAFLSTRTLVRKG